MKSLIVYDSHYGSTQAVAQAIAESLLGEVQLQHVDQVNLDDLASLDLLIIGSPTFGAKPSDKIQAFLPKIGAPGSPDARAAAFDTRLTWRFLKSYGFAAHRIEDALKAKGWTLAVPPEGFYVKGIRSGKLKDGELARAVAWSKGVFNP